MNLLLRIGGLLGPSAPGDLQLRLDPNLGESTFPLMFYGYKMHVNTDHKWGGRNGGKAGRGSENKQRSLIAVQTGEELEHPTVAVIESVKTFDKASLRDWIER